MYTTVTDNDHFFCLQYHVKTISVSVQKTLKARQSSVSWDAFLLHFKQISSKIGLLKWGSGVYKAFSLITGIIEAIPNWIILG